MDGGIAVGNVAVLMGTTVEAAKSPVILNLRRLERKKS
jgi:hypothetical protein